MAVLINEEEFPFLRIGPQQVKVEVFWFSVACKKLPDLENLIKISKYIYLLNKVQCWNLAHSIG